MMKWISTGIAVTLIILIISQWSLVAELRNENLAYFTEEFIPQYGWVLVLITIPLMVAQNVFTIFPIIIVILIHIFAFGFFQGFLFSLAGTTLGAGFCFLLARSWSEEKLKQFWSSQRPFWKKLAVNIDKHSIPAMVLLRSIPIMPSNVISVAAAVTPIKFSKYMIATLLGNMSMIWILSLMFFPVWQSGSESFSLIVVSYSIFLIVTAAAYIITHRKTLKGGTSV